MKIKIWLCLLVAALLLSSRRHVYADMICANDQGEEGCMPGDDPTCTCEPTYPCVSDGTFICCSDANCDPEGSGCDKINGQLNCLYHVDSKPPTDPFGCDSSMGIACCQPAAPGCNDDGSTSAGDGYEIFNPESAADLTTARFKVTATGFFIRPPLGQIVLGGDICNKAKGLKPDGHGHCVKSNNPCDAITCPNTTDIPTFTLTGDCTCAPALDACSGNPCCGDPNEPKDAQGICCKDCSVIPSGSVSSFASGPVATLANFTCTFNTQRCTVQKNPLKCPPAQ